MKERQIRINKPRDIIQALNVVATLARRKDFEFGIDEDTLDFIIPAKQYSSVSRRLRRREIGFKRLYPNP